MEDQVGQNKDVNDDKLQKEIEELLNYIPEDKKEEALKIFAAKIVQTESTFSGPLPPPTLLEEYNNVLSKGAERIMRMAENQTQHRIELEKHAVKEELRQSKNGQIFGFILAVLGMGIALLMALLGHDTVAGIFGTTTIVGLVTVFVIGKKHQKFDD